MITGDEVKEAMVAANITTVPHHQCGVCGGMVFYVRGGEQLFFDSGCGCSSRSNLEPREWSSAADWINMQSDESVRGRIKARFGL